MIPSDTSFLIRSLAADSRRFESAGLRIVTAKPLGSERAGDRP
jgi:hypothetical protein